MILFLHFDYLRNHLIQYFKIVLESFAAASGIVDHDTFGPEPGQGKAHGHAVIIVGRYGAGVRHAGIDSDAVRGLFAVDAHAGQVRADGMAPVPCLETDVTGAEVRSYREGRPGSDKWANMATFSTATDLFRFRVIPGVTVTTDMRILCDGHTFEITSVEDVKGRGMYLEVLVQEVKPGG